MFRLQFCTALHTLLMMTAESTLSKRAILRFAVALLFPLKLFSSHVYCIDLLSFAILFLFFFLADDFD